MKRIAIGLALALPCATTAAAQDVLVLETQTDLMEVTTAQITGVIAGQDSNGAPTLTIRLADDQIDPFTGLTASAIGSWLSVQVCETEVVRANVMDTLTQPVIQLSGAAAAPWIADVLSGRGTCPN
jgi:hypothetical protein